MPLRREISFKNDKECLKINKDLSDNYQPKII